MPGVSGSREGFRVHVFRLSPHTNSWGTTPGDVCGCARGCAALRGPYGRGGDRRRSQGDGRPGRCQVVPDARRLHRRGTALGVGGRGRGPRGGVRPREEGGVGGREWTGPVPEAVRHYLRLGSLRLSPPSVPVGRRVPGAEPGGEGTAGPLTGARRSGGARGDATGHGRQEWTGRPARALGACARPAEKQSFKRKDTKSRAPRLIHLTPHDTLTDALWTPLAPFPT